MSRFWRIAREERIDGIAPYRPKTASRASFLHFPALHSSVGIFGPLDIPDRDESVQVYRRAKRILESLPGHGRTP